VIVNPGPMGELIARLPEPPRLRNRYHAAGTAEGSI
jgi:hypothetical protein